MHFLPHLVPCTLESIDFDELSALAQSIDILDVFLVYTCLISVFCGINISRNTTEYHGYTAC